MLEEGKLELLLEELERHNMNITGFSETRAEKGNDKDIDFKNENHTIVFSETGKEGQHKIAIVLDKHCAAAWSVTP